MKDTNPSTDIPNFPLSVGSKHLIIVTAATGRGGTPGTSMVLTMVNKHPLTPVWWILMGAEG